MVFSSFTGMNPEPHLSGESALDLSDLCLSVCFIFGWKETRDIIINSNWADSNANLEN